MDVYIIQYKKINHYPNFPVVDKGKDYFSVNKVSSLWKWQSVNARE